jgi:hypothetical protein
LKIDGGSLHHDVGLPKIVEIIFIV